MYSNVVKKYNICLQNQMEGQYKVYDITEMVWLHNCSGCTGVPESLTVADKDIFHVITMSWCMCCDSNEEKHLCASLVLLNLFLHNLQKNNNQNMLLAASELWAGALE